MPAITPGDREELLSFCEGVLVALVVGGTTLVEAAGVDPPTAAAVVATPCAAVKPNVDTNEDCPRPARFVVHTVCVNGVGAQPKPDRNGSWLQKRVKHAG